MEQSADVVNERQLSQGLKKAITKVEDKQLPKIEVENQLLLSHQDSRDFCNKRCFTVLAAKSRVWQINKLNLLCAQRSG